jgi:hypothetical protein
MAAELAGKKDDHHGSGGGYGSSRFDRDMRDVRDTRYHPADTRFEQRDSYRSERGGSGGGYGERDRGGRDRDRERDRDARPGCTLYVRNLHDRVDENTLRLVLLLSLYVDSCIITSGTCHELILSL